jgi:hypothetical protein
MSYRTYSRHVRGTVLLNMTHKTAGKITAYGLDSTVEDYQCGCKKGNQLQENAKSIM